MSEKPLTILDDDHTEEAQAPSSQADVPTKELHLEEETGTEASEPEGGDEEQPTRTIDQLTVLQKVNAELNEQVKRTAAEFQNFRRRQEEEAKRVKVRLREDILRSFLPILDHLDRTLQAVKQGGSLETLTQGVELIDKDVKKIFEEHGLKAIPAQGETFDPALHQAVMMQETNEVPDQTIMAELQKGYQLEDRVLRPSMVQVARNLED